MTRGPVNTESRRKRFILRIGPGLALALLGLVLLWPQLRDGMQSDRPRIERSQLAAIPAPPAAPDLAWVLERRDALRLGSGQAEKLRRLKERWDRKTGALREALDRASKQFDREMASPAGSRASIQDLRERAAPVSDLSRELTGARRSCWSETSHIMTAAQRSRAEEAWTRHLAGRRQATPSR